MPSFDEIFRVMAAASSGDAVARVEISDEPDLEDPATKVGIALNLLLDDLAFRVAERERAEARLKQSQRLEAMGTLVGGVAHDFNNLLSVILGYADLALVRVQPGETSRAELEEIRRAGQRAGDLVQQLLAFGRKQLLEPRDVDLNAALQGMDSLLRRVVGESVEMSLLTFEPVGKISIDPSQLEQIVMNLAVNARDAMPSGGKLTIETSDVDLDQAYADLHPEVLPGPYVMLAVTDTGVGMPPEVRARIFEPFFTTKEQGRGTGLGLSTVFGIVHQSGGHVWVYSEPGSGTTFRVYLPNASRSATRARTDPLRRSAEQGLGSSPGAELRGSETVLVVEDDPQLRALVREILGRNGYNVLVAETPGDALLVAEEYGAKIHLLLSDVILPRMSGKELAERLLKVRPNLAVLFVSGYTDSTIVHHGILDAGIAFLQKPLLPAALLHKVREVLDA